MSSHGGDNIGFVVKHNGPLGTAAATSRRLTIDPDNLLGVSATHPMIGDSSNIGINVNSNVEPNNVAVAGNAAVSAQTYSIDLTASFTERAHPTAANVADGLAVTPHGALRRWRQALFATAENDPAAAGQAVDGMERALASAGSAVTPEHRITCHFDLAKFWAAREQHARAFEHWRQAHAVLSRSQPFSRAGHLAAIEASMAAFSADRFARGPRVGNRDPAPVFIVGMPRSGTTLCEQILAAHRDVHAAGERVALGQLFSALGGATSVQPANDAEIAHRVAHLDGPALDQAAASYLAELHALAPGKARIVDRTPDNYLRLGLAGLMLPGAQIIHCIRDPRDIGLSIFTHQTHGLHGYAHDLADLGWTITQHNRLMEHWRQVLPKPVLTVALPDWIEDFAGTIARVLAHLDLPPDANCARFHEIERRAGAAIGAQVQEPIHKRGLGRWRRYAGELAPLIGELQQAGEIAAAPIDAGKISGLARSPAAGELRAWRPSDPATALGLAVHYLMRKPVFEGLPFGEWSAVLMAQIKRGHACFIIDSQIRGFMGWALAPQFLAEAWVTGRAALRNEDCYQGDCVIFNAWCADNTRVHDVMVEEARKIVDGRKAMYWKRYRRGKSVRPVRVAATQFTRIREASRGIAREWAAEGG